MSSHSFTSPLRYRFEDFEFRERTGELWRSGTDLHLPDQAAKVLLALLRAPGEVVTRDELRQVLWPDKVCGDFEGGLHAAIRKLRRALEDDGAEPRLIGTLPRRGYRLLVPVMIQEDRPGSGAMAPGEPIAPAPSPAPVPEGRSTHPWQVGKSYILPWLLFALLALGVLLWKPWRSWPRAARTLSLPDGGVLEMVYIPPGEFAMGFDTGFKPAEQVHRVSITHGFWMAKTEVTQAQWRAVMGNAPAYFKGDNKPVEQVSWEDCQIFLKRLNQIEKRLVFRLPTEAEWEYAARATGLVGEFENPEAFAWGSANSQGQTHAVGQKRPNPWGLFDMIGNVWEWCSDGFGPYLPYPQKDPQGPPGELRTVRGGSWLSPGWKPAAPARTASRVTLRYGLPPDSIASDVGFRVVAAPRTP